jgi:hypothetical protein
LTCVTVEAGSKGLLAGHEQDRPVPAAAAPGTTVVLAMDHRIKAGQGIDGPSTSLFGVTVPIPAGKQVRSLTLPTDSASSSTP